MEIKRGCNNIQRIIDGIKGCANCRRIQLMPRRNVIWGKYGKIRKNYLVSIDLEIKIVQLSASRADVNVVVRANISEKFVRLKQKIGITKARNYGRV